MMNSALVSSENSFAKRALSLWSSMTSNLIPAVSIDVMMKYLHF